MQRRSDRRRRLRSGREPERPLISRRDVLIAAGIAATVGIAILVVVVASLGGGDNSEDVTTEQTVFPPFSPDTPDGAAIVELARSSIEVLPRGEWPSLYDSFTSEYQQRCPRDEFVAAGEAGAQEQGTNLPLLRFVNLEQVSIESDNATAVVVGEIQGLQQYKLKSAFRKVDGSWKISPTEGTSGCNAFGRLEG
jgi:hypothetical protein